MARFATFPRLKSSASWHFGHCLSDSGDSFVRFPSSRGERQFPNTVQFARQPLFLSVERGGASKLPKMAVISPLEAQLFVLYKRPMGAARKASWIYRTSKGTKRYLPYTLKPSRRGKIAQMCPGGRGKATLQPYRPVYKERIFVIRGMDVAGSCCIHYWPTDYILFSRLLRPLFLLRFALCPNETRGKNMEA